MLDARAVADRAWRAGIRPEPQLAVSAWADRFRMLPSTSAEPGRWRTSRVPYLQEVMDCLSVSSPIERIVLQKGAQTGGTEAALNFIGYVIANAPGLVMLVMPSVDMVRRNTRTRIDPLIEATPELAHRVVPARSREPGNTAQHKRFTGGELIMTGANAASSLRSTPIRFLIMDEVDAFPHDVEGEGDPVALAVQRTVTYRGRRKILMISTPTIRNYSRIERAYLESDQRRFLVPCPECSEPFEITWDCIRWPEGDRRAAFCACPSCGGVIEEHQKPALLSAGTWRASEIGDGRTAGFHLSALYSPFETWGEIAEEHSRVYQDPPRLKAWVNTKLGETWEEEAASRVEPAGLAARMEEFGTELPEGVVAITAGIDMQDEWFAAEIVGWGRGEESWSLDYAQHWSDPTEPAFWDAVDALFSQTFPLAGGGELAIRAACMDSGGSHTARVLEFCAERHVRKLYAVKGANRPGTPAWPRRATLAKRGKQPLYVIGVDALKEVVFSRLAKTEAGPGACHFPIGRAPSYFAEMTAEKPFTRFTKGRPLREWRKRERDRNEAFDCRVYALAALESLKISGLSLDREAEAIEAARLRPQAARPAPTVWRSKFLEG